MSRVRLQLSPPLAASGASCAHLWWPVPASPLQIKQLVREVLNAVGLNTLSLDAINVTLDGFKVLMNSSTGLLRDGELLEIDFASNKRKRPQQEIAAAITPAPKKVATAAEKEHKTPGDAVLIAPPPSETRPSRSARRKAAKRLRKRQGLEISFPVNGRRHQPKQQQEPKAAAGNGRFKATALEAAQKKKFSVSSSDDDEEESSSSSSDDDEGDTTSSSTSSDADRSSDSDSSSSSSSSSEEEEEEDSEGREWCRNASVHQRAIQQDKLNLVFSKLEPCNGMPSVGRVVAYKLLEIGEDYAPRVSEARLGKVVVADTTENVVIIQPHPDPLIHPLLNSIAIRNINKEDVNQEEVGEEEREPPPSNYDEDGILTAELATFSELRYYDKSGLDDANLRNESLERGVGEEELPLGPTNYSRLGPPAAAAAGATSSAVSIRDPEILASLVDQLQQRRAEIALAKETPTKTNNNEAPPPPTIEKEKTAEVGTATTKTNNKTERKKNPRHRGALQSAIGPMLRMLRSSEEL